MAALGSWGVEFLNMLIFGINTIDENPFVVIPWFLCAYGRKMEVFISI